MGQAAEDCYDIVINETIEADEARRRRQDFQKDFADVVVSNPTKEERLRFGIVTKKDLDSFNV